ncbi:YwiC-like family protein [Paenibacillus sp. FSL W8-0919]|uniref:YwiC-like family protein n=1 Tax=Paenibacillus sp. FSL W8-0919 TaxID=2954707 RepID=UPI0030FCF845
MNRTKIVIPREHGGWAMLIVPYMIGMTAAKPTVLHVPLFLAWLLLYFASYPLLQSLKRKKQTSEVYWGIGYAAAGAVFLIPVIWHAPWMLWFAPVLLALITVNIWHVVRRKERALLNDLCAILLFCTGGAAAYMLGGGTAGKELAVVALVNVVYFAGTVFFVKSVFRERKNKRYTVYSRAYHVAAPAVPLILGLPWLAAAFLFPLCRSWLFSGKVIKPMKVGIIEIIGSVQFLGISMMVL